MFFRRVICSMSDVKKDIRIGRPPRKVSLLEHLMLAILLAS